MPGIAEQLKLWAKGRGNPSKKDGDEEDEKKKKETAEKGGRPAGSPNPNKPDEVPMPPFGKSKDDKSDDKSDDKKPNPKPDPKQNDEEEDDNKDDNKDDKDLSEWAKKAKQNRKFPQFKKGE